jgi:hypothetical protein
VQRLRASKAMIDEPIRPCDDMKWIISSMEDQAMHVLITCGLMEVGCLCGITNKRDEIECTRKKRYICRAFHF